MRIQILGSGCAACTQLAERAEQAARGLGLACELEKVSDLRRIAACGVLATPALVVDGRVLSAGRRLSLDELKAILGAASA